MPDKIIITVGIRKTTIWNKNFGKKVGFLQKYKNFHAFIKNYSDINLYTYLIY